MTEEVEGMGEWGGDAPAFAGLYKKKKCRKMNCFNIEGRKGVLERWTGLSGNEKAEKSRRKRGAEGEGSSKPLFWIVGEGKCGPHQKQTTIPDGGCRRE